MKRDRHILGGAWLLAMVCLVVGSCRTGTFDEQDIEAARLLGLKRQYDTLDEAVSHLLEVNSEAMRENPDLRFVERGLHRLNEMRSSGLPGEAEYLKYRASYPDRQKFEQTYTRCRQAFGIEQWAEALRDPQRQEELKPLMIFNYRHLLPRTDPNWPEQYIATLAKQGLRVFDPNDPDDDRLWLNIKWHMFELAERMHAEQQRLIEEGVSQFMRRYLGLYDFANACSELYWYWMRANVPKKLVQAAKAYHEQEQRLSAARPGWTTELERLGRDPQAERRRLYIANSLRDMLRDHFSDRKGASFQRRDSGFGN